MKKKKQIVFFCATTPYVMIYKIAREFKKRGYETILITISQRNKWDIKDYHDAFDKIICSNFQLSKPNLKNFFNMLKRVPYLARAIYEMKKLKPYVVFSIANPTYITALAMRFFKKYPIIYFPYDISSQEYSNLGEAMMKGYKEYEVNAERYCFEHADGIMHKGAPNELQHLKTSSMLGSPIKTTPLNIFFPPYCSDEFIVPINKNKLSKEDNEFHLAYVGGLFVDKETLEFYRSFFQRLIDQNIHIHSYSKTQHLSKEEDKKNLLPLIKSLDPKFFHIEFALPPKKLIKEISKYDFGLFVDCYGADPQSVLVVSYSTGNKISSYLEAGIPFFYSKNFMSIDKILKKYNLDLGLKDLNEFNDFNKKLKKLDYAKLEKNILRMRKDFNMAKHFLRLENFIKEVIKRKKSQ